tara:strand:+ start:56 stop:175 length:120 start_codon:yes stop_codon:yes gene_type:complete
MTIEVDELKYPITIEIPEDYWCMSYTPNVTYETEEGIHE